MTDEILAKVHRTPLVTRGPPLRSLSRSPGENLLRSQPCVDRKRHDTYILVNIINNRGSINIVVVGHYLTRLGGVLRYSNPSVDRILGIPHAQISVPTQHDHITLRSHGPLNLWMLLMQLIKESHHGDAYYRLDIEGLWHRCYKVIMVCKNSFGRHSGPQGSFSSMLSKCCTLKRASCWPVRLSVPVSVQSLSYDVSHAWACSARLSEHS